MIRPLRIDDGEAVNRLYGSVGWPMRSSAGWSWLASSPARQEIHAPLGWAFEADGEMVAVLGNLILPFDFDGRRLRGATGFSIVVTPAARGASRSLIQAFLQQDGVFAHYTLNANSRSAGLYVRHGMRPWPEATADLKLSWVADPAACLGGRLWRAAARLEPGRVDFAERLANSRLSAPRPLALPDGVERLTDLSEGSDYAEYWRRLSGEGRLRADRSPAEMAWRLADPDLGRPPLILAYRCGEAITGAGLAILAKGHPLEPPVLEVLDVTALDGEAAAVSALMRGFIDNAFNLGAAKTRLPVVSPWLLARLGLLAKRARREGGWGHCHAAFGAKAPDPALWSPSAWDGDYSICLRPAPFARKGEATRGRDAA